ncbi:Bcr/CflA family drug resistance efflux transporter [Gammaproteobacteria bacterium 45_16_T64]|nr:Bcr/CflA family drug resistance efflux transporter [Gammaproteobacteria bacterium 45_16_T64]
MKPQQSPKPGKEFIFLMALLMSLVALTIDAMLPALGLMAESLTAKNPNDIQLVISTVFIGMAIGLMLYGPISDSFGRKNAIYLGVSIFLVGTAMSGLSDDFTLVLLGRVIQGFGAASCRVVTTAMIRDSYSGPEMGRVMSLIMVIFVMVPALAPSLGQIILIFAEWRAIFGAMFLIGLLAVIWLALRQAETLSPEKRIEFSFRAVFSGVVETLRVASARGYTLAAGLIFGAFVGYLSSAQQILQDLYEVGDMFAVCFGGLALCIGASSYVNAKLVMRMPMEMLCLMSLIAISLMALLFFLYAAFFVDHPPLMVLMAYLGATFFCLGILFGNFSTLAVQPLGHIAGVATSVISSIQTFISVAVGGVIGQSYNGTVLPLVMGFLVCGILTLIIVFRVRYLSRASSQVN